MTDTLVAAQHLAGHLAERKGITEALTILKQEMIGSFCFTFLTGDGSVYAARTLRDLGPLLSEYTNHRTLTLWHQNLVPFLPWEPICLETSSRARYFRSTILDLRSEYFAKENPHAHCAFEYTYFAHPTSVMEGVNVYAARKRIGEFLAREFKIPDADLVIPVPDSARPAAPWLCARKLACPSRKD